MNEYIEKYRTFFVTSGVLVVLFLFVATITKVKEYRFIGSGIGAQNTITVTGEGKVDRAPDTAKISFTVQQESKEIKTAQDTVSTKIDAITNALQDAGIAEKYIKTDSYNSYPQYNYPEVTCLAIGCPKPSTPVLRGYEVSHSVTVAIKDLEKVEAVLGILAAQNATNISGPNFGFEDDKAIAREARDAAIADAKTEATKLAKSLGVHLVRIVSFSESAGGSPMPMYARDSVGSAMKAEMAPASLPVGEQSVRSNVTIVYEIR